VQAQRILDVQVDNEHAQAGAGKNARYVDAQGGLAYATFRRTKADN
jgi:hypothetical protein